MDMHVDMTIRLGRGGCSHVTALKCRACACMQRDCAGMPRARLFVFKVGVVGMSAVPLLFCGVLHLLQNLQKLNIYIYILY